MTKSNYSVPHLVTKQSGTFYQLEKKILEHTIEIESWFREIWQKITPLVTCSVDLRNAGFKITAVDANVFPAGFNNLNPDFYPLCIQAVQSVLYEKYPFCKKILILPESHTRNLYYYESISILSETIKKAGYEVQVGSFLNHEDAQPIILSEHKKLTLQPIQRTVNDIHCGDFIPDLIILNNDLSEGIPEILQGINQPIDPPPELGWSLRSKTQHFTFFNEVCDTFAEKFGLDVWQICPLFLDCGNINFVQREGIECLVQKTQMLLSQIQLKYNEYELDHKPFVVIKADAGTYGMAVMPIHDPEQLINLNRKQRQSMSMRKGGQSVNHVILQEGVYTFETIGPGKSVAEPVVYMIGQHVVGGFYRVHQSRGVYENLNSPGMHFEKLAFAECCNNPDNRLNEHLTQNQFYVYSVIARLALLAACKEREALTNR